MDSLPIEILHDILEWNLLISRFEKNAVIPLRLVCRAFNAFLKPYIFKTIQLEFSYFLKSKTFQQSRVGTEPDLLPSVGQFTKALYLDLILVRDSDEMEHLNEIYLSRVYKYPEMGQILRHLEQYIMGATTFDEQDFRRFLQRVLESTPNMQRMKINLPFPFLCYSSHTSTVLLATTLECLTKRKSEHQNIQTLVLENLSDTSVIDIVNNPIDFTNASNVFSSVQELYISIKRLESSINRQNIFSHYFWLLIRKSVDLKSLFLRGTNIGRRTRLINSDPQLSYSKWIVNSFPLSGHNNWKYLRHLKLKRIDVNPTQLLDLFKQIRASIREVHLIEIFLKVSASQDIRTSSLWTGCNDIVKHENIIWMAEDLRRIEGLNLDILHASGLGYDNFASAHLEYNHEFDIQDPLGLGRSLDQRFVDAFFKRQNLDGKLINCEEIGSSRCYTKRILDLQTALESKDEEYNEDENFDQDKVCHENKNYFEKEDYNMELKDHDAEKYQSSTRHFEFCIDNIFFYRSEQPHRRLRAILEITDQVIELLGDVEQILITEGMQDQIIDINYYSDI